MKIYTKTGDTGETSLIGGKRIHKSDIRLEAYGTIDELNANIGLLCTCLTDQTTQEHIRWIQHKLFVLGSALATEGNSPHKASLPVVTANDVARLEQLIDKTESELQPVHSFVLPGACREEAVCHICRTVCRRAERRVFALKETGAQVDDANTSFLNRLSDYLFVLARKMNRISNVDDFLWNKSCH